MITPQEYIEKHEKNLKEEYNNYDIQINKLGIIGNFLNILGWTQYDLSNFYNYLFGESSILTATDENNIELHSSIWGYKSSFATSATAIGDINFDFSILPNLEHDQIKREVILSSPQFEIDGINFYTDDVYYFVREREGPCYGMIFSSNGEVKFIPSSTSNIKISFSNFRQKVKNIETVTIQNYPENTFYPYTFKVPYNMYIEDLEIRVGEYGETYDLNPNNFGSIFNIKKSKFLEGSFEKTVFLSKSNINEYKIEFGDGNKGLHVPNRTALITNFFTNGRSGNINKPQRIELKQANTTYNIYKDDNTVVSQPISLRYFTINFNYSYGGSNIESSDELKNKVIKFIRSKENFLSEQDFYDNVDDNTNDFSFLFRKTSFIDNTFYICKLFRDKYQNPAPATNITLPILPKSTYDFNHVVNNNIDQLIDNYGNKIVTLDNFYTSIMDNDENNLMDNNGNLLKARVIDSDESPIFSEYYTLELTEGVNGLLPPGNYEYIVKATDYFSEIQVGKTQDITLHTFSENEVILNWDSVEGAIKYIIYCRNTDTDELYRKYETFDTTFTDDIIDENLPLTNIYISTTKMIFFPIYNLYNTNYISPFIYIYDEDFKWFDGYIFYKDLFVHFNNRVIHEKYYIPIIFFKIEYDHKNYKTNIYVKSYQDISDYNIYLTILELGLNDYLLQNKIDDNTWLYEYSDGDYSILWDSFSIELSILVSDNNKLLVGKTNSINQVIDISNLLRLSMFISGEGKYYMSNIPVIEENIYNSDPNYYLNLMINYLNGCEYDKNAMVTDDIQFRFLNSSVIPSYFVSKMFTQTYNFDIHLPFKIILNCKIDNDYIINNSLNLNNEKDNLKLILSKHLQSTYTGKDIIYYNSQIDEFVHNSKEYIKEVIVSVYDNNNTLINSGLEKLQDDEILTYVNKDENLEIYERKLKILEYVPPYFYWDVDNIEINFVA